jgi:hypothetical protein
MSSPFWGRSKKRAWSWKYQFALLVTCCTQVSCLAYSPTLMMQATYSSETSADFNGLHGVICGKIEFFINAAVRSSNSMSGCLVTYTRLNKLKHTAEYCVRHGGVWSDIGAKLQLLLYRAISSTRACSEYSKGIFINRQSSRWKIYEA